MMIDLNDFPMIEFPHLAIYLFNSHQLQGIMSGKARITNLPEGATIYKILLWKPDECDSTIAVWFSHPDFRRVHPGDLVETRWPIFEEIGNDRER